MAASRRRRRSRKPRQAGRKVSSRRRRASALRQQLTLKGKLVAQAGGSIGTLMEDITFASPTAATQFVYGGAINGRVSFKDAYGKSIKDVWG